MPGSSVGSFQLENLCTGPSGREYKLNFLLCPTAKWDNYVVAKILIANSVAGVVDHVPSLHHNDDVMSNLLASFAPCLISISIRWGEKSISRLTS